MAAVNRNMFDASVTTDRPQGASLLVLPLNLIAKIIASLDDPGDLARLCRACRVLNYMTLPQLYKNLTLTSYDKIRYRGDQPEGIGSASPFSMGLNAVITRPYASLVRSLTLRGDWREHELEEHARVGRVPDSSMMLNIAVRAALDRMTELEDFRWELSTKMLETVYLGLAQLPKLTSLTIRFPSSRHPRPTIVIPAMPHLLYLKITDIDPLCYPDDISTLLFKAKKLKELKMHWSPRMRNAQEPSVILYDYFRKCISAKYPLPIKKLGLQNLYARHSEEFETVFDPGTLEEVTVLNEAGSNIANSLNTFFDSTWPTIPANKPVKLKSIRSDVYNQRQSEFLGCFTGLEKIYMVNPASPSDNVNSPRLIAPSATLTPPASDHTTSSTSNDLITPTSTDSPGGSSSQHARIRDLSLNSIILNHGATIRHLLLPARWPLSSNVIARLVHASPQLEQLAFATEFSSLDTLSLILPFLRNLVALRLLIPTGAGNSAGPENSTTLCSKSSTQLPKDRCHMEATARSFSEFIELDDDIISEKLSEALADQQIFRKLQVLGIGRKAFLLGEYYTVPVNVQQPGGVQSQTPDASRAASADLNGQQDKSPLSCADGPCPNGLSEQFEQENGYLSPAANQTRTNSPKAHPGHQRPHQQRKISTTSVLGKRTRDRDDELCVVPSEDRQALDVNMNNGFLGSASRALRRRVRRASWDVLKQWEIWGLDTQEL